MHACKQASKQRIGYKQKRRNHSYSQGKNTRFFFFFWGGGDRFVGCFCANFHTSPCDPNVPNTYKYVHIRRYIDMSRRRSAFTPFPSQKPRARSRGTLDPATPPLPWDDPRFPGFSPCLTSTSRPYSSDSLLGVRCVRGFPPFATPDADGISGCGAATAPRTKCCVCASSFSALTPPPPKGRWSPHPPSLPSAMYLTLVLQPLI